MDHQNKALENKSRVLDYVGWYSCGNTFWTTSDNIPTCWTLDSFGFQTQPEDCEAKVILLGGVRTPSVPCNYPSLLLHLHNQHP